MIRAIAAIASTSLILFLLLGLIFGFLDFPIVLMWPLLLMAVYFGLMEMATTLTSFQSAQDEN